MKITFGRLSTILWKEGTGRPPLVCTEIRASGMMHTGCVNQSLILLSTRILFLCSLFMFTTHYVTVCTCHHMTMSFMNVQVAKANGGSNAANQVAYLWAKSLGEN